MVKLILLGGGKIGSAIAAMLGSTGEYQITVADRDGDSLKRLPTKNVKTQELVVTNIGARLPTVWQPQNPVIQLGQRRNYLHSPIRQAAVIGSMVVPFWQVILHRYWTV